MRRLILPHKYYDYYGEPLEPEDVTDADIVDEDDANVRSDGLFLYEIIESGVVITGLEPSARPLVDVLVIPVEIDGRPVFGLGMCAFNIQDSIAKIVIPETVVALGWQALSGVRAVEVAANNPRFSSESGALFDKNKRTLIHFPIDGDFQAFRMPDTVKVVGESAFLGCKDLTRIVLPEGVERIDDHAFEDCESLEEIVIPQGVVSIGDEAFSGCYSLEKIALPDSVETIGDCAFTALNRIVIPKSVKTIGCFALPDEVEVDPENPYLSADANALFNKDKTKLICIFSDKEELRSYVVPDTVREIGESAFQNYGQLTSVVFPEGLETIGESAFLHCMDLKSALMPDSVKNIGKNAFMSCSQVADFVIPKSLEKIGKGAFGYCSGINGAGMRCDFILPKTVREIGEGAFPYCANIMVAEDNPYYAYESGALYDKNKTRLLHYYHDYEAKTLVLPKTLKEIDDLTFWGECKLDRIVVPASVEKIGAKTFLGTGADIEVADDNPHYSSESGALFNKDKTKLLHFPTNGKLETYVVPDSVQIIEEDAFYYCQSLKRIVIPPSVREIGANAFHEVEATFCVHKGTLGEKMALLCECKYEIIG